jgi:hypothetical protein
MPRLLSAAELNRYAAQKIGGGAAESLIVGFGD